MLKLISVTTLAKPTKKNVQFSAEVDLREKRTTIIQLLVDSVTCRVSNEKKSLQLIDEATHLVETWFKQDPAGYNKLLAKCYAKKVILLPLGKERDRLSTYAHSLEPTREKYRLV